MELQKIQTFIDSFLKLISESNYDSAYANTSAQLKKIVTPDDWKKKMELYVKPLGKTVSRQLGSSSLVYSLAGLPDGIYHIFSYESSFEFKKRAQEIIVVEESGENLFIIGYQIK